MTLKLPEIFQRTRDALRDRPSTQTPTPSPAPPAPREHRMAICRSCEHAKPLAGGLLRCGQCGCVCQFKSAFPSASCPVGKW